MSKCVIGGDPTTGVCKAKHKIGDIFPYTGTIDRFQDDNGKWVVAALAPPESAPLRAQRMAAPGSELRPPCGCVFDILHPKGGWACGRDWDCGAPPCTSEFFDVVDDVKLVYMPTYSGVDEGTISIVLTETYWWLSSSEWSELLRTGSVSEDMRYMVVRVPTATPDGKQVDVQEWLDSRGYGEFGRAPDSDVEPGGVASSPGHTNT